VNLKRRASVRPSKKGRRPGPRISFHLPYDEHIKVDHVNGLFSTGLRNSICDAIWACSLVSWQAFYHFLDFLSGGGFVEFGIWDMQVGGVRRAEGLCDSVCFGLFPRREGDFGDRVPGGIYVGASFLIQYGGHVVCFPLSTFVCQRRNWCAFVKVVGERLWSHRLCSLGGVSKQF